MAWYEDAADRLLVAQAVTTAPVIQESRYVAWHLMGDLSLMLKVSAVAAGAGDSLIVLLQHSIDHAVWATLVTFATVLGTTSVPYTEFKTLGKGGGVPAWGPWLRALATPAGASAAFTIVELHNVVAQRHAELPRY
jgi:hypothetical protein